MLRILILAVIEIPPSHSLTFPLQDRTITGHLGLARSRLAALDLQTQKEKYCTGMAAHGVRIDVLSYPAEVSPSFLPSFPPASSSAVWSLL